MFTKLKVGDSFKFKCKNNIILLVFRNVIEDIRCPSYNKFGLARNIGLCFWKEKAILRFDLYIINDSKRIQFYKTIDLCVCSVNCRNKSRYECCFASVDGAYTKTYMDGKFWFIINTINLVPSRYFDGYEIRKIKKQDYEVLLEISCFNNIQFINN